MSDIKTIDGLELWEIVKRVSDGEKWAVYSNNGYVDPELYSIQSLAKYIMCADKVAIIDTSTPEIDWEAFNWDFFNQYGGIPVIFPDGPDMLLERIKSIKDVNSGDIMIRESPLYYWAGGEQPVPDNVEVEVEYRHGGEYTADAGGFDWDYTEIEPPRDDIIAFKLTGRVL